jgi:hypothetical protein
VGRYRFWRDFGFVVGAIVGGFAADVFGFAETILAAAALTAGSGVWVAATVLRPIGGTDETHLNPRLARSPGEV